MNALPRLVVAGTHSGVGKTTVATGLMRALARRGLKVAPFKVGPDFIDPGYHEVATGLPGRNLDLVLEGPDLLAPLLRHGAADADVAVIEGVMGLFDGASRPVAGAAPPGGPMRGDPASTAHVARLLDAPVALVVDAGAMAGSVAALVHGYATFDPALRLVGVVANRVGGARHAELVAGALAPLGIPLLGWLPVDAAAGAPERHLGLVPAIERPQAAEAALDRLAHRVAAGIDLDAVLSAARSAPDLPGRVWQPPAGEGPPVPIAVAAGQAFSFAYAENHDALTAAGAELVAFDPTRAEALPDGVAGLYLGGGFPETHAEALAANASGRRAVAALVAAGAPVLAECGGYLYLCRSLDGRPMCGLLAADAVLTDRPVIGYREATAEGPSPFWRQGQRVRGHVFHHSRVDPAAGVSPAWRLDGQADGHAAGNVHASYLHTHWAAMPEVAGRFVAAARRAFMGRARASP